MATPPSPRVTTHAYPTRHVTHLETPVSLFRKTATPPPARHTAPARTPEQVPAGLVSLVKSAAVSLEKAALTGQRAAVYLVLDHSGSMMSFYNNGSVQRLAEQTLALSANLDDDGTVPLIYFADYAEPPVDVLLDTYQGVVAATHVNAHWGMTDYASAMRAVIREHEQSGAVDPGLCVFQSDGAPTNRAAAEKVLREASSLPLFWAFIGFGDRIEFLERLDDLGGRKVDNASFFHARNPLSVSDAELYDGITREYAGWLSAATAAGIVR